MTSNDQITEILVGSPREVRENACEDVSFGLPPIGQDEGSRVLGQSLYRILKSRDVRA